MKIALVGATGNVGRSALHKLIEARAEVTVLVRAPEKLPESVRAEARIEAGDLEAPEFVTRATRGAEALLWLTPSAFAAENLRAYTLGLAENAARAIRENEIHRVVFVSSHGADRPGIGHVSFAGEVEKTLEGSALHTRSLRSAGHMENLLSSLEALRGGRLFGVLHPQKTYPLVAARDVGEVAARWLLDSTWGGHEVRGVHGAGDLSAHDQAEIIGRMLGRPVQYQQIAPEALRDGLLKRGASASVAEAYMEMFRSFAREDYAPSEERNAETTTPTTFETFVREVLAPRLQ